MKTPPGHLGSRAHKKAWAREECIVKGRKHVRCGEAAAKFIQASQIEPPTSPQQGKSLGDWYAICGTMLCYSKWNDGRYRYQVQSRNIFTRARNGRHVQAKRGNLWVSYGFIITTGKCLPVSCSFRWVSSSGTSAMTWCCPVQWRDIKGPMSKIQVLVDCIGSKQLTS